MTEQPDLLAGTELLPCPFCGEKVALKFNRYHGTGASGMETPEPFVRCLTEGCATMPPVPCDDWPYGRTVGALTSKQAKAEAVRRWNTRAAPDLARENAELRQRVKALEGGLEPFARYADLNDLQERDPDGAIEVPILDLLNAASLLKGEA